MEHENKAPIFTWRVVFVCCCSCIIYKSPLLVNNTSSSPSIACNSQPEARLIMWSNNKIWTASITNKFSISGSILQFLLLRELSTHFLFPISDAEELVLFMSGRMSPHNPSSHCSKVIFYASTSTATINFDVHHGVCCPVLDVLLCEIACIQLLKKLGQLSLESSSHSFSWSPPKSQQRFTPFVILSSWLVVYRLNSDWQCSWTLDWWTKCCTSLSILLLLHHVYTPTLAPASVLSVVGWQNWRRVIPVAVENLFDASRSAACKLCDIRVQIDDQITYLSHSLPLSRKRSSQ